MLLAAVCVAALAVLLLTGGCSPLALERTATGWSLHGWFWPAVVGGFIVAACIATWRSR